MEDYGLLSISELVDLLSQLTFRSFEIIGGGGSHEEFTVIKKEIEAVLEELKKRKHHTGFQAPVFNGIPEQLYA
jgi:hypothetical protein